MKIILLLTLILVCSISIYAQAPITIKPSLGLNQTFYRKDMTDTYLSRKTGFQFGGTVAIGKKIFFEPGVFYMKRNTDFVITGNFPGTEADNINFDFTGIRVPLAIGINFLGNAKSNFSMHAVTGFSAFFVTGGKYKTFINSPGYGFFVGTGVNLGAFFLDVQYDMSLNDVHHATSHHKPGTALINLGYRLNVL